MNGRIAVDYDPAADVLYVALGEPVPADTDEDDFGLLVRTSLHTGAPCGVTVLGFVSHWMNPPDRERLAHLVGQHLRVPDAAVRDALRGVAS